MSTGISSYDAPTAKRAADLPRDMGVPCLIHQPSYNMPDRWIEQGVLDVFGEEPSDIDSILK